LGLTTGQYGLADLVVVGDEDCCWAAKGMRTSGYRQLTIDRKQIGTHRAIWELVNGPIPEGMFVCHRCDNRGCGNPRHLFLGSSQDNHRDMTEKRRLAHGERQPNHKLTDYQVAAIRKMARLGVSGAALSRLFGVTDSCIYNYIHMRSRRTPTVWHDDLKRRRQG
jgi:HNH endonuclease